MWQHWNSMWAPGPGDPPAVDDPVLWQSPWTPEQAMALQARHWEAMLSASHSWWAMLLSAWPMMPTWPLAAWGQTSPDSSANAGTKTLSAQAVVPHKAAPRKRAPAEGRRAAQPRKH